MHQALLLFFSPLLLAFYAPPSLSLWHLYANTNIQKRITVTYPNGGQSTKKKKEMRWRKRKKMRAQWFSFFRARNSFKKRFVLWILLFLFVTDESNRKWAWFFFFFFWFSTKKKKKRWARCLSSTQQHAQEHVSTKTQAHMCVSSFLSHLLTLSLLNWLFCFFYQCQKGGKKAWTFTSQHRARVHNGQEKKKAQSSFNRPIDFH